MKKCRFSTPSTTVTFKRLLEWSTLKIVKDVRFATNAANNCELSLLALKVVKRKISTLKYADHTPLFSQLKL